jgi:uroporphyrinogen decarboxylase
LKVEGNPFPEQIKALEAINDGLAGRAHFVETIFNPWTVAEKLSSKEDVLRLKEENPRALLAALEIIAESETHHARKAVEAGASGVFLAIANAQEGVLSRADYAKFSEPFDRMILKGADSAPLNTLHLHGDKVYMDLFYSGWPAAAISYSAHATGVAVAEARRNFPGLLLAGIDEVKYRSLSETVLKKQELAAKEAAGKRFVLAPGCSVPNETTDEEMLRLTKAVKA